MNVEPDLPIVDLWFQVKGNALPTLHGHLLYAALSGVQPLFHEADWLGIHTLHGVLLPDQQRLHLPSGSRLGLRLPFGRIGVAMPLVGQTLRVGEHPLTVGFPEIRPLVPASSVSARMVTIKGFQEPEGFAAAVVRQLGALGIHAPPEVGPRLVQRIDGYLIVGFALRVHGLTEAESLTLQAKGIGGRRRMGCGLFRPSRVGPPETSA